MVMKEYENPIKKYKPIEYKWGGSSSLLSSWYFLIFRGVYNPFICWYGFIAINTFETYV